MLARILTAVFILGVPAVSSALPAYARQTGLQCSSCHAQQFPTLNAFGRRFKLDGFTLVGAQDKVEGKCLSMPAVLNAALFLKLRYQKTNGDDGADERTTNSGEVQFPDEFAFFLGGRVSENIGFFLEGQLPSGEDAMLAGFKMPFSYNVGQVRASVVPFTTDGLGASYGFELLNTGAVRNIRFIEHRKDFSAQQYVGTGSPASGAAFVVGDQRFFVNYTRWSPVHLASALGEASPIPSASYLRAAWTPAVGAWDLGVGVQKWYGSARVDDGSGASTVEPLGTKAWAVDGQAQRTFGQVPLTVVASYASAAGSEAGVAPNLFNGSPNERTAIAIATQLGVIPERATVLLAYRAGDNGKTARSEDRATTIGGTYLLHQNVQLQMNYTLRSGNAFSPRPGDGNRLLTLMLAAGF